MTKKEAKQFYDSAVWQKRRADVLKRDHYECQDCRERITTANRKGITLNGWERYLNKATCVHHIVELQENPELGLDPDNLVSLCNRCHNERHGRVVDKCLVRKKVKYATEERW